MSCLQHDDDSDDEDVEDRLLQSLLADVASEFEDSKSCEQWQTEAALLVAAEKGDRQSLKTLIALNTIPRPVEEGAEGKLDGDEWCLVQSLCLHASKHNETPFIVPPALLVLRCTWDTARLQCTAVEKCCGRPVHLALLVLLSLHVVAAVVWCCSRWFLPRWNVMVLHWIRCN